MRQALALLISAPVLFVASAAFAEEPSDTSHPGGYAVGVNHTIADLNSGSTPGISARYFVNDKVGLELVGAYGSNSFTPDGGKERSSSNLDVTLLAEYRVSASNSVAFSGYGGLDFATGSASAEVQANDGSTVTSSVDTSDLRFELGLKGEYFLARGFSVFGRTGITIDPQNEDDGQGKGDGMALSLFGTGSPVGQFGFSIWFK